MIELAVLADQPHFLDVAGRIRDGFAAHPQHLREHAVRHLDLDAARAVVGEQEPAAKLVLQHVVAAAERDLLGLRHQQVRAAEDRLARLRRFLEQVRQHARAEPVREAVAARDHAARRRAVGAHELRAHDPFVADLRDLERHAVGRCVLDRDHGGDGQIHMLERHARFAQHLARLHMHELQMARERRAFGHAERGEETVRVGAVRQFDDAPGPRRRFFVFAVGHGLSFPDRRSGAAAPRLNGAARNRSCLARQVRFLFVNST